jgi:aspartyl-tRNA(Asn)/glutamyl-tRNA(Gln) amidotransferase subunit A
MAKDLAWFSAVKLLKGYRKRRFSPVEVTSAVLDRIAVHNGALNAFCHVDAEAALNAARASERRWAKGMPQGRLDGVPVSIKDLILTAGMPTLRGSQTIDPHQPFDIDAPVTARLRESGAIILGKTTTPEFGWKGVTDSPLTGITRNPWDRTRTPGGSSGGAAVAVATGMGPLAIGTDGGGSIRIPAAFTGIFGLKPSFGRVPAWPLSPFGTVAHVGPLARSVEDAAIMLNVIAEPDARDWHALPYDGRDFAAGLYKGIEGFRIAFSPRLGHVEVDPEVARVVRQAVRVLRDLGAKVEEVDPGFADPMPEFRVLWWSGARALAAGIPEAKRHLLERDLADVVASAASISLDDYLGAIARRGQLGAAMRQFMARFDLLVTPTLPIPAFEVGKLAPQVDDNGKWVNWTPFTYPFNLTQQPAASICCGFTRKGLPVGLQLIGRMFEDHTVMRSAFAFEQATNWRRQHPPLVA